MNTQGQDAISVAVEPHHGDTLFSMVDNLPLKIEVGRPGPNQVWDFTSLQSPFIRKYAYHTDSTTQSLSIDKSGASYNYVLREGSVFLSAIKNADPLQMGLTTDFKCSPALLEYKNPINYQDASSEYSRLIGYLPWSKINPSYRIAGIDLSDSMRIVLEVNRDDAVDAWGSLLMQNEAFEVLRIRRIEEQVLRIQSRLSDQTWTDVTEAYQSLLKDIMWSSITYSYIFLAENLPGPVAEVYTNAYDDVEKVIYSADPKMAQTINPNQELRGVYVHPNPTFGDVRFEFFHLPPNKYELSVYSILGKELWSTEAMIENEEVIQADLSFLKRGTYFYSLSDSTGKRIVTRRLVIIKP